MRLRVRPLHFLGLGLSQHLPVILWTPRTLLPSPQLCRLAPLQPGTPAAGGASEQCRLAPRAAQSAQVLPQLPGTILRNRVLAWKGCFALSTPPLPPLPRQEKIPLLVDRWATYKGGSRIRAPRTPTVLRTAEAGKSQEQPLSPLLAILQARVGHKPRGELHPHQDQRVISSGLVKT